MYCYSIRKNCKRLTAVLCLFIFVTITVSCTGAERPKGTSMTIFIEPKNEKTALPIEVETAITAQEQQRGFMQRKEIPDGTGMIFIYTRDEKLRFWMKDTPHPLSIAFIDSAGHIREIYDMQPFSLDVLTSIHSVRYALEVAQGYFGRAGISAGDTLSAESLECLKAVAQ